MVLLSWKSFICRRAALRSCPCFLISLLHVSVKGERRGAGSPACAAPSASVPFCPSWDAASARCWFPCSPSLGWSGMGRRAINSHYQHSITKIFLTTSEWTRPWVGVLLAAWRRKPRGCICSVRRRRRGSRVLPAFSSPRVHPTQHPTCPHPPNLCPFFKKILNQWPTSKIKLFM